MAHDAETGTPWPPLPQRHTTTVTDATQRDRPGGYGPFGHGTWRIACTCGWATTTRYGGRNGAEMAARDHTAHAAGSHTRPVYGCQECPR